METQALAKVSSAMSIADVRQMANDVAASGLMKDIRTPEAAFTLMMLCQAEGMHPIQALRRYHIIEGKPAMRADAMLSDYLRAGGTVEWVATTHERCEAVFTARGARPVTITWTIEDAKRADLAGKTNWKRYPAQMLRARTVSDGVRMTDPGIVAGIYTPEEVADFDDDKLTYTPPPKEAPAVARATTDTKVEAERKPANDVEGACADVAKPAELDPVTVKRVQTAVSGLKLAETGDSSALLASAGDAGARREVLRVIRLNWITALVGRKIGSVKELTPAEASQVVQAADLEMAKRRDVEASAATVAP